MSRSGSIDYTRLTPPPENGCERRLAAPKSIFRNATPEGHLMKTGEWPYPRWVAHRGAGKLAPENTLAAFRHGAKHGYRMFECDVKLSRDGAPFLLHDATLNRTTNGKGAAGDQDWAALSQLDAGSWHSDRKSVV